MYSPWLYVVIEPIIAVLLIVALRYTLARLSQEAANTAYMIISTLSCISMFIPVMYYYAQGRIITESAILNLPYIGKVSIWINPISAMYLLATCIVATCVSVYSLPYMTHRLEELRLGSDLALYYILYILYILGLAGTVYFTNLIIMFIFVELSIVTSFLLILFYGYGDRLRVALLYFIWSQLGSLSLLCGIIIMLMNLKTVYVPSLHPSVCVPLIAMYLVLIGCLIKMGTFLVHFWLPWAHAEAPSPISAILSPVQIGIMSYVLIEILHTVFRQMLFSISLPLIVYGIVTGIYGAVMALAEQDVKRFLAYSSIAHMGALTICIAYPSPVGEIAAAIVFIAHAFAKALLFLCSGYIIYRTGIRSFPLLGGLYEVMTSSSIMGIVGFVSLSGVFNIGLISKIYLTLILFTALTSLLHKLNLTILLLLLYIAMLCLSVAYCFYAVKRMYFGRPREGLRVLPYTVYLMEVPMAVLAICTVLFMMPNALMPMIHLAHVWNFLKL